MKELRTWWESRFLKLELGVAIFLTSIFVIWFYRFSGEIIVDKILYNNRSEVYGSLAALFGALLGFVITSVSIVIGYSANERLTVIRESKHYHVLWEVFQSTMKVLAIATVAGLLGLIFDRDDSPVSLFLFLNFLTTILSAFRVARSIWILENIIKIVTRKV